LIRITALALPPKTVFRVSLSKISFDFSSDTFCEKAAR
jgi:hypothetical protein